MNMQLKSSPRLQGGQWLCPESMVTRRDVPTARKIFPGRLCVPCGFIVSLTTLRRMISTQKGNCLYVCERKEDGVRRHSLLTAKYSYAYVHTPSLSENRNGASQNNQNISEVKCLDTSREQFRVFVYTQKKLRPQFRESPVH